MPQKTARILFAGSLSINVVALATFWAAPASAAIIQTKEGCAYIAQNALPAGLDTPSWSGACKDGIIDGVGGIRGQSYDSNRNVVPVESWYEAFGGQYDINRNPYYFQLNTQAPELTSYWRSRAGGFNDRVSEAECRTLAQCKRILDAREAQMGAQVASKQSTNGDAALATVQREQAEATKSVDYSGMVIKAGAAAVAAKAAGSSASKTTKGGLSNNTASYASNTSGAAKPVTVAAQSSYGTNDPFVYSPSVNNCVVMENKPGNSAVKKQWRNTCNYEIKVTFCEIKTNNNECSKHITGAESLKPGQTNYILIDTNTVNFIACKAPYYLPSSKLQWSGDELFGRCQASPAEVSRQ